MVELRLLVALLFLTSCGQCHSPVHLCCLGRKFVLDADILNPPHILLSDGRITGYLVELLELIVDEMGMELVMAPEPDYFRRVGNFMSGNVSAFLDVTTARVETYLWETMQWGDTMKQFGQELPTMTTIHVRPDHFGAVLRRTTSTDAGWRLFRPFTNGLWFSIIAVICGFAMLVLLLETLAKARTLGWAAVRNSSESSVAAGAARALYYSFATILSGEGEECDMNTWPARILRLGFLFFVLVTVATYTANLASIFTAPAVTIHGPQSMSELGLSAVYIINQFFVPYVAPFANSIEYAYGERGHLGPLVETDWVSAIDWGMDLVERGEAPAFCARASELAYYQKLRCNSLVMAEHIHFGRQDQLMIFHAPDHQLANNVSVALDWIAAQRIFNQLEDKYFGTSSPCADAARDDQQVSVASQVGLFVIFGAAAALSLATALWQAASAQPPLRPPSDDDDVAAVRPPTNNGGGRKNGGGDRKNGGGSGESGSEGGDCIADRTDRELLEAILRRLEGRDREPPEQGRGRGQWERREGSGEKETELAEVLLRARHGGLQGDVTLVSS